MQPSITTRRSRFDMHNIRLAAAITGVFVGGMVLGGLSREVDISNPFDDDARPAVVAHVPDRAGEGIIAAQTEGVSVGVPVITGGPGDITSYEQSRFQDDNLYLPVPGGRAALDNGFLGSRDENGMLRSVPPVQDYSLDWARFFESNGVVGALTEPVVSIDRQRFLDENIYMPGYAVEIQTEPVVSFQHQRFLDENIYMPGYTVETEKTAPMSGEDVPLYLPDTTPALLTSEEIQLLEQNLYLPSDTVETPAADILTIEDRLHLPSDGNGFVDVEPLPLPAVDRADLKAYYEAGMGQGWFIDGKPADAVDTTYLRAVGSWVNEGSGEGWVANGKPADDTTVTNHPSDRGAGGRR